MKFFVDKSNLKYLLSFNENKLNKMNIYFIKSNINIFF
jgi:hypothetical protein